MLIIKSNCFKQSLGPMLGGHPEMEDVTGFEVNPTFLDAYMNEFWTQFLDATYLNLLGDTS